MVEPARPVFARALALQPSSGLEINRATLLPAIYDSQSHIEETRTAFETAVDTLLQDTPKIADPLREVGLAAFYLPYQGYDDRALQTKLAHLYATACPALTFTAPHATSRADWQPERRLRVGFVSKFLRDHTIGKLNHGFIAKLDRQRFHVTTLSPGGPADAMAKEIAAAADRHIVLPMDLAAARETVAEAKLDILFFTDIGMEPFTYFLAFARLAPVQCVAWGHPVTSGLATLDYFISNPHMDPPGSESHYAELLVRLSRLTSYYRRRSCRPPPAATASGSARRPTSTYVRKACSNCIPVSTKSLPAFSGMIPRGKSSCSKDHIGNGGKPSRGVSRKRCPMSPGGCDSCPGCRSKPSSISSPYRTSCSTQRRFAAATQR